MANLKDLKIRIGSVKSTQKITKAMQMVAASKLRRAEEHARAGKPYGDKMQQVVSSLATRIDKSDAPALLVGRETEGVHKCLYIVATSDRGLCGGFNTNIVRLARSKMAMAKLDNIDAKLLVIGKKGREQLSFSYKSHMLDSPIETFGKARPEFEDALQVADFAVNMFEREEIDSCVVLYNKFVSVLSQVPTAKSLIPLEIEEGEEVRGASGLYEYEPSEERILASLLPANLAVQIYNAMLQSAAGEQAARMTAMDNATRNAGEMIGNLTLVYNRTRQAAITTELTEIISGAEAL